MMRETAPSHPGGRRSTPRFVARGLDNANRVRDSKARAQHYRCVSVLFSFDAARFLCVIVSQKRAQKITAAIEHMRSFPQEIAIGKAVVCFLFNYETYGETRVIYATVMCETNGKSAEYTKQTSRVKIFIIFFFNIRANEHAIDYNRTTVDGVMICTDRNIPIKPPTKKCQVDKLIQNQGG